MATKILENIVSLAKRRGFVFQSSEIYGGLSSAWDYGPLGVELKNRIQQCWWREMTRLHDNIVGIDTAILMHPRVWEASGHVENFHDPMVDCRECKSRFRSDHIDLAAACSVCGASNSFTEPRQFNLMFKTNMGPTDDGGNTVYLRPETAQGIYVNYRNVLQSGRMKIPFGIAQVGKAFRNEIVTKNFIFRTCEFEQMEMQYFIHPSQDDEVFEQWKAARMAYYATIGIRLDKLRFKEHGPNELAHYAKKAFDIEYEFPFGWQELEGIHNRTDFDLRRHAEFSGKDLSYLDDLSHERFTPFIIETSAGLTRSLLMVLCDAYEEESLPEGDVRSVLRFHPEIAPITVAVFPLVKKDGLAERAREVERELRHDFTTFYDQGGAIGRRYRRQDEIGTPFCLTIDYETKENDSVTLRDRDSMEQRRLPIRGLAEHIRKIMKEYRRV